jgi:hypothetical protein
MKKVFAVIVTYKRAEVLKDCLEALLIKSSYNLNHLHIIVNCNDNLTLELIEAFQLKYPGKITYAIFDNIGPAGGFYYGLKEFLASDSDFVWLMDDDIIPEPDCLQRLLEATSEKEKYISPKVINPQGEQVFGFGWWGVLLAKEVIEKVGLPLKDFFYWGEDTEYLQNRMIREYGVIPLKSNTAIVTHLHERNKRRPDWYYYYAIRNSVHYRRSIFPLNLKGIVILNKLFAGLVFRILMKENSKLNKIRLFILGLNHGMRGKLGKINRLH